MLLPSAASAHAYLVRTVPAASGVLDAPPPNIQLTYDEAVEPRFAIISVTNAAGRAGDHRAGPPLALQPGHAGGAAAPASPGGLVSDLLAGDLGRRPSGPGRVHLRGRAEPGPAPQFKVPNISATATTPQLLIARWVMFLSVMAAIGLFALRLLIARPLARRVRGTRLRPISVAFVVASVVGLIAIPVYLDFSTANDSLRSVFDLGALVPLFRRDRVRPGVSSISSSASRSSASPPGSSLWLDRPEREHRSIAELAATAGALLAAAAVLIVPGAAGHAAQTSPRGSDAGVRLASPAGRLAVAGRAGRPAGAVVALPGRAAGHGAVGRRASLLERRARFGAGAARQRDRRDDHPHAGG